MATEDIKIAVVTDTGSSGKSLKDLKDSVKSTRTELEQLTIGTEDYRKKSIELTKVSKELRSAQLQLKTVTTDTASILSSVTRSAAGLTGGFNALQGTLSMLTNGSEELNESFGKVATGISIVQGLTALAPGIKSLTTVFKLLNTTMLANPAVLIAVGIIGLGAVLMSFTSKTKDATDATDMHTKAQQEFSVSLAKANDEFEYYIRLLKAQGATTKEIAELRVKTAKDELAASNERIESIKREQDALLELQKTQGQLTTSQTRLFKSLSDEWDSLLSSQDEIISKLKKEEKELTIVNAEEDYKRTESAKREAERKAEAVKTAIAQENEAISKNSVLLETNREQREYDFIFEKSSTEERIALTQSRIDSLDSIIATIEELRKNEKASSEQITTLINLENERAGAIKIMNSLNTEQVAAEKKLEEATIAFSNAELLLSENAVARQAQIEIDEAIGERKQELVIIELQRQQSLIDMELSLVEARYEAGELDAKQINELDSLRQKSYNSQKKITDALVILEKTKQKAQSETLKYTADTLSTGAQLLGENTVAGKAMGLAQATISTYTGAASALKDLPYPANIAAVASTIATGFLQVKEIMSVKIPDATDTTSAVTATSLPSMPDVLSPVQETSSTISGYQEEALNALSGAKIYTSVTDIEQIQNKVTVTDRNATL